MGRRSGPALYELLRTSRPGADGEAAPAAPVRIAEPNRPDPAQMRTFALAALAIAAIVIAYLVGSASGERAGRARLLAEQEEELRLAASARPAMQPPASGNAGGGASTPAATGDRSQPPDARSDIGGPEDSGLPNGPLPPAEPGLDPRTPGLKYYVLASTLEENAARVVAFCRARGLDAYVVRDHNGRLREVTVLPGFRDSESGSPRIKALEERIREVGRQFKASGPGNSDFGDRYSKLFKGT